MRAPDGPVRGTAPARGTPGSEVKTSEIRSPGKEGTVLGWVGKIRGFEPINLFT